jgi:hypothetical protein
MGYLTTSRSISLSLPPSHVYTPNYHWCFSWRFTGLLKAKICIYILHACNHTWALIRAGPGRAGPRKSPTQYSAAQARPGPTIGPQISAQARPVGLKNHRAVGPSGWAFSKSSFFPTQARPVTLVGPKYPAQARPDSMLWPDGPGHFRAGSGRAGRAGLPMPSYTCNTSQIVSYAYHVLRREQLYPSVLDYQHCTLLIRIDWCSVDIRILVEQSCMLSHITLPC